MIEEKEIFINKYYTLFFCIIIAISAFNLFYNLNRQFISDWDEALYGTSAFEMVANNNYIVNTYLNKPDYWVLKPPLGLWLIALSYKTFGVSNFSLRFPSALSALLTIFLVMIFARSAFNRQISLLSGIILATSKPFINLHSGRSGDFDAPLALFIFTFIFFLWLYDNRKNIFYFYLGGFAISITFLLKSFTVVMPLTIMFLYLIFDKRYKNIRLRQYLVFLFFVIVPLLPWIYFRYQYDGLNFFQTMISYDLLSQGTESTEGHNGNMFYYFDILRKFYMPWALMLLVIPFYSINLDPKQGIIKSSLNNLFKEKLLLLAAIIPFLITIAYQTKLRWYINPAYPPLAVIISWYLWDIIKTGSLKNQSQIFRFIVIFIFLASLFAEYTTIKDFIVIKHKDKYSKQDILLSLKPENYRKHSVIYDLDKSRPSEIFVAKVLKGIEIRHISDIDVFIKEPEENLLIMKNIPEETRKIGQYRLTVVANNYYWVVVESGIRGL